MSFVYKLAPSAAWARAQETGVVEPAEVDRRDGFIHLSTANQALETARLYFAHVPDVVALEIDPARLSDPLRYEMAPKRGEAFPHLYGALPTSAVVRARALERAGDGFVFADAAP